MFRAADDIEMRLGTSFSRSATAVGSSNFTTPLQQAAALETGI
jgi:hypothetical protein